MLVVIAAPTDAPPFDADGAWQCLGESLEPLVAQRKLVVERLPDATEAALRRRLAEGPIHALHFIGHGRSQQAAKYATLALRGADGRARNVTMQYLGALLKGHRSLRLLVLQAGAAGAAPLGGGPEMLPDDGLDAVLTTRHLDGPAQTLFTRVLYGLLAGGATLEEAVAGARDGLTGSGAGVGADGILLSSRSPAMRLIVDAPTAAAPPVAPAAPLAPRAVDATRAAAEAEALARQEQAKRKLERKRLAGAFDVFLCHSWADKPAVKKIAQQLKDRGVLPWLDEWELPPGQPWQPLLERQIASIKSAAVFVGAGGVGPWQEQELYGFLREFVARRSPVIPVLLMNAPEQPKLPVFLNAMTWVDFRKLDPDPLAQLVWGITGNRQEELP